MSIGNIEKRGEGKYRLTVAGGFDPEGRRIKHRKTIIAKSDKEASKQLAIFVAGIEKGEYINVSKLTFNEFAQKWLIDYAEHNLADKTLSRYLCLLRDNIKPIIGHLKLEQIKPMHLLDLYTGMTKNGARKDGKEGGYSTKTIKHVHRLTRSMLEKAVQWQLIPLNPATRVQSPKDTKKEVDFYDAEQVKSLFEALKEEPIKYRTIVMMAVYTAMRRSEIMGLEWGDVDWKNNCINVSRATLYVPGKGIITKDTKTVKSKRSISMTQTLSNILCEYKEWHDVHKAKIGDLWQGTDRLFIKDNGLGMHPDTISDWFPNFIKRKNLPHITLHGLRHTSATLLLSSGVDLETVSRILGHASSNTTSNVYLHSAQISRMDAAVKLEDILRTNKEE